MEASGMVSFLETMEAFFSQSVIWVGDVVDVIANNPMLMIMAFGMPIVGFAVGLLSRLIRL